MHTPSPRTDVQGRHKGGGIEQVPFRDGKHQGALQLGAPEGHQGCDRESNRPRQDGGEQGWAARAPRGDEGPRLTGDFGHRRRCSGNPGGTGSRRHRLPGIPH